MRRDVMTWMLVIGLPSASAFAETGKAVIRPTAEGSSVSGEVTLTDTLEGLNVEAKIAGVPPGQHGFHIHEFGDCGDAGKAAGGHYNPHGAPHEFLPKDGEQKAHAGDMGNIEIGQDGSGTLSLTLSEASLSTGEHHVGGRAVILHEKSDDFSQPTGNAGGRIGCGVIMVTGK
jgi:Cu-Zn family superoxide dismutase